MTEAEISVKIRLRLGARSDVLMFRNTTGVTKEGGRTITYGLAVGSSDLVGCILPAGRFVALEVKAEDGRVTEKQRNFMNLVRMFGGFAAFVRSADEAEAAVERAKNGASE